MEGYKKLLSYKLTLIQFLLTWEFVPQYYFRLEDSRQRDQLKQAVRSKKHPDRTLTCSQGLHPCLTRAHLRGKKDYACPPKIAPRAVYESAESAD